MSNGDLRCAIRHPITRLNCSPLVVSKLFGALSVLRIDARISFKEFTCSAHALLLKRLPLLNAD